MSRPVDIAVLLRSYGRPDLPCPTVSTMVLGAAADEIERLREAAETLQLVVTDLEGGIANAHGERAEWEKLCGEAHADLLKEVEAHCHTIRERDLLRETAIKETDHVDA